MERIVNCLELNDEQRARFVEALPGYEQIFAPYGVCRDGTKLTRADYEAAVIILGNPPAEVLAGCAKLRLLHTLSAGVDRYLEPGVLPEGTHLAGCSGAWGPSIAEHMFAMLLALMKRLPAYRDQQRAGDWNNLGREKTLMGARVLVVGTGDLGSSFAMRCKALGASTVGIRRDAAKSAEGVDEMHSFDDLDSQLPMADVVALLLPHTSETAGLLDARRLALLKDDAILLNGGRGTAVDCLALSETLGQGRLWGAGLDVTSPEPLPADHPLWQQDRVIITPHTAGGHLDDTRERIVEIILENLRRYFAGEKLRNQFL